MAETNRYDNWSLFYHYHNILFTYNNKAFLNWKQKWHFQVEKERRRGGTICTTRVEVVQFGTKPLTVRHSRFESNRQRKNNEHACGTKPNSQPLKGFFKYCPWGVVIKTTSKRFSAPLRHPAQILWSGFHPSGHNWPRTFLQCLLIQCSHYRKPFTKLSLKAWNCLSSVRDNALKYTMPIIRLL